MATRQLAKIKMVCWWMSFFMISVFCLCSCNGQGQKKAEQAQDKVVYRLKWLFNASTIGDLWARDRGLFDRSGLKVILKEGGAEHDAIEEIELGRAEFGVASSDQVIRAVSRGADVVVLAQLFKRNPLQWIYMADKINFNPKTLSESLKRVTIGITYGGNDEAIFWALARKLGLNPGELNLYAITYDYTPFWQGKVDLWPCYRNTQGILLSVKIEKSGHETAFLDPYDYGIRFVANSVISSRKFVKSNPELTRRFLRTIIEAWQMALSSENISEAVSILKKYDETTAEVLLKRQILATKELVAPVSVKEIGIIKKSAWKETEKEMYRQGLIKKRVNVEELFCDLSLF